MTTWAGIRQAAGGDGAAYPPSAPTPEPDSYVHHSDLQGLPDAISTCTIMVDGRKLQNLLRPKHPYYANKGGSIESIDVYEDADQGRTVLYAKARATNRENPYRLMQLRRQTSGRTARAIFDLFDKQHLDDVRVAELTLTYPAEVSEFMADNCKKGRTWANDIEKRFWNEAELAGLYAPGSARSVNLHTWKTEKPVEPHFHHHELIPNYTLVVDGDISDVDDTEGEQAFYFKRANWDTGPGGTGGMWNRKQLELAKKLWATVVYRFCRQHHVKTEVFDVPDAVWGNLDNEGYPKLNVFIDYGSMKNERGKRWLLHKLNYKARHWSQDYAKYGNEHLDCPEPPAWLRGYDNRTRVFGWWSNIKNVKAGKKADDIVKLSPYTAKPMVYDGRYRGAGGIKTLIDKAGGRLFWVEFIKGQPVEGEYSRDELAWLVSVGMLQDYRGKWYHNWDKPVDLQGLPGQLSLPEPAQNLPGGPGDAG